MAEPVREDFAGEERTFMVRIRELRRIETACDAGVGEIARRLAGCTQTLRAYPEAALWEQALIGLGNLHVADVRETIREGLIGGGMAAPEADRLVKREIDDRGMLALVQYAPLALGVLLAGVSMPADAAPPGGADAGEPPAAETPPSSTSDEPTSPPSTGPAAP